MFSFLNKRRHEFKSDPELSRDVALYKGEGIKTRLDDSQLLSSRLVSGKCSGSGFQLLNGGNIIAQVKSFNVTAMVLIFHSVLFHRLIIDFNGGKRERLVLGRKCDFRGIFPNILRYSTYENQGSSNEKPDKIHNQESAS